MKIKLLSHKYNSTLSCILKYIRFKQLMIIKKLIFGLFLIFCLTSCTSPTAMLGPAYTLSTTGNIYQAGFSYGSNELVTMYTGKSPLENLKDLSEKKQLENENLMKKTLESEDFYHLVKNKINKAKNLINVSNQ